MTTHAGHAAQGPAQDAAAIEREDSKLQRKLGFWSLLAAGLGSVIGSGWLFASMYAARAAGPAALLSWVVGGVLMLMVALVYAELGMVRPESGGLVRYPLYSNGRLAATVIGVAMWLAYVSNPPTEAAGVVQYAAAWLPGVYDASAGVLTPPGLALAVLLMAGFVLLNYFGVRLFARANNVVTAIKILVPLLTLALLLASGFDHAGASGGLANLSAHGGFAPLGYAQALGAVASAGLIFAYTGFRNIVELSGEAVNPRRDIPRSLIATLLLTIALYLALQLAFLVALPPQLLAGGWHGVNMKSPFADLARMLGLSWLYWMLMADAMISPSGSAIVFTSANARNLYGIAKNGLLPRALMHVHAASGVPRRALLINFLVGVALLLPLPSWHAIVRPLSAVIVFTFSIGAVALPVFRAEGIGAAADRLPGMRVVAPLAFIVSTLVMYWASWSVLRATLPVMLAAVLWYAWMHLRARAAGSRGFAAAATTFDAADWQGGAWLLVYLALTYLLSWLSTRGGLGWFGEGAGSALAVVLSLGCYAWGVRAGRRYVRARGPGFA
ncbi:APC family permease [Thiomonas sp. FB-6]|uniref:APC family permease n=1 Tax=Thiomonas sp. FB-6 TaxID=1158291 RepID=UPI0003700DBC|nr:APC family permease [Thiomonas sp. FB-6]